MRYSVSIGESCVGSDLTKKAAIKAATESGVANQNVFVSWFRDSDGQKGFLNPDGSHAVTGISWSTQGVSVRKNITQPADWWQAFEATAKEAGLSLSEWAGECMLTRVPKPLRDTLSKRLGAHRPKRKETNAE
jgi:hypothetical protein